MDIEPGHHLSRSVQPQVIVLGGETVTFGGDTLLDATTGVLAEYAARASRISRYHCAGQISAIASTGSGSSHSTARIERYSCGSSPAPGSNAMLT